MLKIGSRGSKLALSQTEYVKNLLENKTKDKYKIVVIKTKGDIDKKKPIYSIQETSIFTKEIEMALLSKKIDLAVHSLKDLSSIQPKGLALAAFPQVLKRNDVFISNKYKSILNVPLSAIIATSSKRRQALFRNIRDDILFKDIRGNIETRIKIMKSDNNIAGIILASAGLERLNISEKFMEILPIKDFIPASGQGIIAVQTRINDVLKYNITDNKDIRDIALKEIFFMQKLKVGCSKPVGIHITKNNGIYILNIFISDLDFNNYYKKEFIFKTNKEMNMILKEIKNNISKLRGFNYIK